VGSSTDTHGFLRSVRLFRNIEGPELGVLADSLRERPLKRGQILLREGDTGDEMFLVRSGSLVISKAVTGRVEQVLARVGPGDFFGEMALFDRSPRSATIQADSDDALLLVLDRAALARLTEVSPRAAAAFFESLVLIFIERLRASGDLVAEVTRWGLEATGLDVESR
jgi:CRP-like cAMP-binding protein